MDYDVLKLKNQLCFPLYAAAKEVVNQYKSLLDEINLTYTQLIVLMVLWEHKTMGVKELGEYLFLDSGTLTPLLKRLEVKKLITRARSAEDERIVNISVTESGQDLREKAAEVRTKVAGCMPLTQDEALVLYKLLYKILNKSIDEI